jgi:hypothetical protein
LLQQEEKTRNFETAYTAHPVKWLPTLDQYGEPLSPSLGAAEETRKDRFDTSSVRASRGSSGRSWGHSPPGSRQRRVRTSRAHGPPCQVAPDLGPVRRTSITFSRSRRRNEEGSVTALSRSRKEKGQSQRVAVWRELVTTGRKNTELRNLRPRSRCRPCRRTRPTLSSGSRPWTSTANLYHLL